METFKKCFAFLKSNKLWRWLAIALGVLIIIALAGKIFYSKHDENRPIIIGVVTDIHAGNQDTRKEGLEENNILHPIDFEKNFGSALKQMKDCDFILALGDNLNSSSKKYAEKLKKAAEEYPVIWTKGNHENDETFKLFHELNNYYFVDKGNWRIIVLDNGNINHSVDYQKSEYIPRGYMEPEQVEWLKGALKTDKKIVVSMHVPIFDRFNPGKIYSDQEYLAKMFEESGNVKYVLAGHFHITDWHEKINGIDYYILPSLSLEGGEGYYLKLELK